MDLIKNTGNQAKDIFMTGAKTVAKVGEYPIHLITSKEVVKYVERPVSTIKTWLKFTAVMLAASLLLWQLIEKIRSYVANPVIVSPEYSYVKQLPFPGLILCNSQPLRYSFVKNTPFLQILNESSLNFGVVNVSDPFIQKELEEANQMNLKEFYLNASQPVYDFIVGCKWPSDSAKCNDSNFQLIITDYGPCYRLTLPKEKWPYFAAAGSVNSLQIVINVDIVDSFPSSSSKTVGAFIALFPSNDTTPVVSHIGFNAPPGFLTSIGVNSEFVQRLPTEKKGTCEKNRKLALFQNYTTSGCYLQNQFVTKVNACSCLPYNAPDFRNPDVVDEENKKIIGLFDSNRWCNAEQQFGCVDDQWEMDSASVIGKQRDQTKSSCPDACKVEKYSNELTYSLISANQLRLSLSKEKRDNITKNYKNAMVAKGQTGGTDPDVQYYKRYRWYNRNYPRFPLDHVGRRNRKLSNALQKSQRHRRSDFGESDQS